MPVSLFSDKEMQQLLAAIINSDGAKTIISILDDCHWEKSNSSSFPDEIYFHKNLVFDGYTFRIYRLLIEGLDVKEASLQFSRPSKFPAPYWNRNSRLFKKLRSILNALYKGSKIERNGDKATGQTIFYKAVQGRFTFPDILEWGGECILNDEPYSSGQTDEDETDIRNDFVIINFNRTSPEYKRNMRRKHPRF